jgi:histidyl-tRNA synthetase
MRDLLPRTMLRREQVIDTIKEVYRSYGFEPLETPACERLDVLLGKYGEEGDQLVFKILHRGEKLERALAAENVSEGDLGDMGLRYDLTVPLARVVAAYQNEIPRYFKRYQIQPVWRAERPQKGRFREFFQCDVDIVGSTSLLVEVEATSAVATVLERLGFVDFRIRLNHRKIISGLIEVAGIPSELAGSAITAIDKLDKIGITGVRAELLERGVAEEPAERLVMLLGLGEGSNEDVMRRLHETFASCEVGRVGVEDLEALLRYAERSPAAKYLSLDPFLARGLSYYTGPIFEIQVADLSGSLGGGGRYDNLVGMFLGRQIPACGFSIGLERILVVMEERGMFDDSGVGADVMVGVWDDSLAGEAIALARELRAAGLHVDLFPDRDKVGKQMKYADGRGYPCVALIGPDEAAEGVVAVKDLRTGEQTKVSRGDVADLLLVKVKK